MLILYSDTDKRKNHRKKLSRILLPVINRNHKPLNPEQSNVVYTLIAIKHSNSGIYISIFPALIHKMMRAVKLKHRKNRAVQTLLSPVPPLDPLKELRSVWFGLYLSGINQSYQDICKCFTDIQGQLNFSNYVQHLVNKLWNTPLQGEDIRGRILLHL